MSDHITKIAQLLTEDPDIISEKSQSVKDIQKSIDAYQDRWANQSGLESVNFNEVMVILKQVAKDNGCIVDENDIDPIELSPGTFSVKDLKIQCSDPKVREKLKQRIIDTTGDTKINFNSKPHTSAYQAINAEFANRLEEAGWEKTDLARENVDEVNVSFMKSSLRAKQPEEAPEDLGMEGGPPPPEAPLEGPEAAPEPLGAPPEGEMPEMPPGPEAGPDMGEFGVEPPAPEAPEGEEAPPEEEFISLEQVQRIADLLTENPDVFNS